MSRSSVPLAEVGEAPRSMARSTCSRSLRRSASRAPERDAVMTVEAAAGTGT
jgi:hypothetical protein